LHVKTIFTIADPQCRYYRYEALGYELAGSSRSLAYILAPVHLVPFLYPLLRAYTIGLPLH